MNNNMNKVFKYTLYNCQNLFGIQKNGLPNMRMLNSKIQQKDNCQEDHNYFIFRLHVANMLHKSQMKRKLCFWSP